MHATLYVMPRLVPKHANATSVLLAELCEPFHRGRGGPGGWWMMRGPELQLIPKEPVVPELAGWRLERMPELPVLRRLGNLLEGVGAQTRSQRILECAVAEHPDWTPAWEMLAKTYMNKANAVAELGQLRAAIGLYDLSLEVWDRLAAGGDPLMRARGAKVRVLRAGRLRDLGDEDTAVAEARAGLGVLEAQREMLVHPDFANLISWAQETFR